MHGLPRTAPFFALPTKAQLGPKIAFLLNLVATCPAAEWGERQAIDPNQPTTLYLAAPSGYGLWKSTDSGTTWAATNFPDVGTYIRTPGDPYLGDNQGDVWVTFDKTSGTTSTGATKTFYVGVVDVGAPVWVTHDGGSTWSNISPETGFLPHKGKIDTVNGYLYVALSDKGGPYDGGSGDVYRLTASTGQWTLISPHPHTDTNFGRCVAPIHGHGHRLQFMVAGYLHFPQHQQWRNLDQHLELDQLSQSFVQGDARYLSGTRVKITFCRPVPPRADLVRIPILKSVG